MEELGKEWYEGTVTAVQLELVGGGPTTTATTGGKRTVKRGSGGSKGKAGNNKKKFKAIHQVKFDDGDESWFDLLNWDERGELEWVGERPTPRSSVIEEGVDKDKEAGAAAANTGSKRRRTDEGKGETLLVKQEVKSGPAHDTPAAVTAVSTARSPDAKKKNADVAVDCVPPESPPHQMINGAKYYMV